MKTVVLTGAAGQLGSAIQEELQKEYTVVTTDCRGDVDYLMDLTDIQQIQRTAKKIGETYQRVDVLINNAGVGVYTPMMQRTYEEFDRVMKTNVYGLFFMTKMMIPYIQHGTIINIASLYGIISSDERIYGCSGRNSSEVYGMSKAAVIQFTRYLAAHLPPTITCNCISPGGIYNNQEAGFIKAYAEKTPLQRLAYESEIARIIRFLITSSYINGENIVADGGYSIW